MRLALALALIGMQMVAPRPPSNVRPMSRVTWTLQANPPDAPVQMFFTSMVYDALSQRVLGYFVPAGASSIYATSFHSYTTLGNDWQLLGGSAPLGANCLSHLTATPQPWPGNRHPVQQFAIDTKRNMLHLVGGVCANVERQDHWRYTLNANPMLNAWTQLAAEHTLTTMPSLWGHLVYSADDDLFVHHNAFGTNVGETWVYCPSASVSSAQMAAGCASAQTWYRTVPGTGVQPVYNHGHVNTMVYDPFIRKVILFVKDENSGTRQVWLYDIATKAWTQRPTPAGQPADMASSSAGDKDHVLITSGPLAGRYLFHLTTRNNCNGPTSDYLYNATTNTYTTIATMGVGPGCADHLVWDVSAGRVVAWAANGSGSGLISVWHGVVQ